MLFPVRRILMTTLCVAATAASLGVGAQQVYRIVGPDGRVTFSDRPPENSSRAVPAPTVAMPAARGGAITSTASVPSAALPFELRTASSRFPVTLYSGTDCGPCASGRAFLASRGIPFTERTVTTADDIDALKRISGAARLPFLTIGGQQINGFSEPEWGQFLDAAGYPRASRLPSGYRNPPAMPLVAVQQQSAPKSAEAEAEAEQTNQPTGAQLPSTEPNPAGIRF
ncbi:MAG TPA: glutaredoxin family protein [Ramlibacter sp.]|jgi:glutaredoxin